MKQIVKTSPNLEDFEKIILGVCLVEEEGKNKVLGVLKQKFESFYNPQHGEIYKSIVELSEKNEPTNIATVINSLKEKGKLKQAGDDQYIIDLATAVSSSANVEFYCYQVLEKYFLRNIITTANSVIEKAYESDADVFSLMDSLSYEMGKIQSYIAGQKPTKSAKDLHAELIENQRKGLSHGVTIPFKVMNKHFYGWQPTDLIIIGARPGMGKSAYALELAKCGAKNGFPTLIFSLEMSNIQLHTRLVANELEINAHRLRKHQLSDQDWQKLFKSQEMENLPLYYEDSIFDLNGIFAKARLLKKELGVKFIIIDYLQLIETKGKQEGNEKVSFISRRLKMLAKELNVPIVVLSQLSREVEKRPIKRPQLSDLRDSGAIEQDADVIQFIYRPEYYGVETWDCEWDGQNNLPTEGEAEIITAKHRHIGTSEMRLKWIAKYQQFKDFDNEF